MGQNISDLNLVFDNYNTDDVTNTNSPGIHIIPERNKLYVIGGNKDINYVYVFDLEKKEWSRSPSPHGFRYHSSVLVKSNSGYSVLVYGGMDRSYGFRLDVYEYLIPISGSEHESWITHSRLDTTTTERDDKSPSRLGRWGHTAVVSANHNEMIIWAGWRPSGYLNDMWRFSIEENVWEEIRSENVIPCPRWNHMAEMIHNKNGMLMSGGEGGAKGAEISKLNDFWFFSFDSRTWKEWKFEEVQDDPKNGYICRSDSKMISMFQNDRFSSFLIGTGFSTLSSNTVSYQSYSSFWKIEIDNRTDQKKLEIIPIGKVYDHVHSCYGMEIYENELYLFGGFRKTLKNSHPNLTQETIVKHRSAHHIDNNRLVCVTLPVWFCSGRNVLDDDEDIRERKEYLVEYVEDYKDFVMEIKFGGLTSQEDLKILKILCL